MSINKDLTRTSQERDFTEVVDIIVQHRSKASRAVEQSLLCAWYVGGYVSMKLKSEEWGSKVVAQLSEYIRSNRPDIKGFSKRNIYNMVMFYDEYSSEVFFESVEILHPAIYSLSLYTPITILVFPTSTSRIINAHHLNIIKAALKLLLLYY